MNEVVINTRRLFLKGISPAMIHHIFETKTEDEIKIFFGVDENVYQRLKRCMKKEWRHTVTRCFSFYWLKQKLLNQSVNVAFIRGTVLTESRTVLPSKK